MTDFVKRRRSEVAAVSREVKLDRACQKVDAIAAGEDTPYWTAAHEKELQFQVHKRAHRECEAYLAGHVAPADADDELRGTAEGQAAHQSQLAAGAVRKAAQPTAKLSVPQPLDLGGIAAKTAYIAPGLPASLPAVLASHGIQCLPNAWGAGIMVVDNVATLRPDVNLCLQLLGGTATIPAVISGSRHGPTLAYLPAVATPREVWLSAGFYTESRELADIVRHIAGLGSSSWAIIHSAEEFEHAKREANKKMQNAQILALVSSAERDAIAKNQPPFLARHAFTWKAFMAFVSRIDQSNWRTGIQLNNQGRIPKTWGDEYALIAVL